MVNRPIVIQGIVLGTSQGSEEWSELCVSCVKGEPTLLIAES